MCPGLNDFKISDCAEMALEVQQTYGKLATKTDAESVKRNQIVLSSLAEIKEQSNSINIHIDVDNIHTC